MSCMQLIHKSSADISSIYLIHVIIKCYLICVFSGNTPVPAEITVESYAGESELVMLTLNHYFVE